MKADVWIEARKGRRGTVYRLRWINPATGKRRCESCGRDKQLAQRLASRKREEMRCGVLNDPQHVRWGDFVEQHLSLLPESLSDKYRKDHRRVLGLFEMACSPAGPHAVNYAMVREYIAERLKGARICRARECHWVSLPSRSTCWRCERPLDGRISPVGANTVKSDLRILRAALGQAQRLYRLPNHPMGSDADMRSIGQQLKVQDKPIRSLVAEERLAILDNAPDDQWRAVLYLAIVTGMRAGEIASLRWEQVRWDDAALLLTRTKSKRVRWAYLDDEAIRLLRVLWMRAPKAGGQPDPSTRVLNLGGTKQTSRVTAISKGFARIVEAAGISKATFHNLRSTFCTVLAEQGVNQKLCQKLAGHASSQTTARYYQAVTDEAARAAARKVRVG